MREMIEDYRAELRHMRENAPYVPWLAAGVAAAYIAAAAMA